MTGFFLALGAFVMAHVVPTRPSIRSALVGLLGERGYLFAYSAFSLLLLVWVIGAAKGAPYVELWPANAWMRGVAVLIMPLSLVLLVAGAVAPNPLSVAFRRSGFVPERPGIVAITRHPILWGFALWSTVHLLANGDVVSVILFGGLTLFAVAGITRIDQKKRAGLGDAKWRALSEGTSSLPLAAILSGRAVLPRDYSTLIASAVAVLIYAALLLQGHLALFGADPLAGLGWHG